MELRRADGTSEHLELVNFDVVNDLALVKTKQPVSSALAFSLADALPQQGVPIYSLGNPHDFGMIVVPGTFNGLKTNSFYQRIHFTGSINPGMSGGPAVDGRGHVIWCKCGNSRKLNWIPDPSQAIGKSGQ